MSENEQDGWRAVWHGTAAALSLGWDLALPIFGGVLIGHLLDRRLETGYWFTMGLLLLGIATGYYNVLRSIRRVEARERRRAAEKDDTE